MNQVYANAHGVVLRDGSAVTICYTPEPGVRSPFGVLTGGRAYETDECGFYMIEFEQKVDSRSEPGTKRPYTLTADATRPGLLDLAQAALKEMANL